MRPNKIALITLIPWVITIAVFPDWRHEKLNPDKPGTADGSHFFMRR